MIFHIVEEFMLLVANYSQGKEEKQTKISTIMLKSLSYGVQICFLRTTTKKKKKRFFVERVFQQLTFLSKTKVLIFFIARCSISYLMIIFLFT